MSEQINKVCANIAQNFSEEEKARARSNIGVDLSSLATKAELDNKQDTIIAGPNIDIYGSTISTEKAAVTAGANVSVTSSLDSVNRIVTYNVSATDTTYTAGSGLDLDGTEFSVDTSVIQPKLTAGANVQINDNVVSATDTTYTAGTNVQINGTVISATDTTYSAGNGLNLNGTTFSVDTSVVQPKLTAGSNITIDSSNVISATDTTYSAGTNVQINNGVISATDTTYTAGSGLALNGTEFSNTAPNVKSDWLAAAGSSAEILNKPTIPTVNDGTLTIQRNGTQVATFSANQSGSATANISVPTDTGDLTNGAGFITASQIPSTDDLVLVSTTSNTPYDDVDAAFRADKTPVLYYGYQTSLQYYWFTNKTASSYTFAAVNKGAYGNAVTEYVVNSDNTITSGSQTSAKRFAVNDETLTLDNGELKWRYPYSTYFGTASSRGGSVNWTNDMTSSHFNRKLVDMPLPAAGIYMVIYNGIGRFVDTSSSAGSPGMLFRVCIGDKTQTFSMVAGQWEFDDSSSNSPYTGFSGFTIVNMPQNYIADASLNISNNDYAPMSGVTQYFHWSELRVAWLRLPQ